MWSLAALISVSFSPRSLPYRLGAHLQIVPRYAGQLCIPWNLARVYETLVLCFDFRCMYALKLLSVYQQLSRNVCMFIPFYTYTYEINQVEC